MPLCSKADSRAAQGLYRGFNPIAVWRSGGQVAVVQAMETVDIANPRGRLIVIPVIASLRLATGLRTAVVLAMAMGVFSSLLGLTIAFYANVAAGGAVVLTAVGLLILVEVGAALRDRLRRAQGRATHPST